MASKFPPSRSDASRISGFLGLQTRNRGPQLVSAFGSPVGRGGTVMCNAYSSSTTAFTGVCYRNRWIIAVDSCELQLRYINSGSANAGQAPGTDPLKIRTSLSFPLATAPLPVTFRGKDSVDLVPGGVILSDPVNVTCQRVSGQVTDNTGTNQAFNTNLPYQAPSLVSNVDYMGQGIVFTSGALAGQIGIITGSASLNSGAGTGLSSSNASGSVWRVPTGYGWTAMSNGFSAAPASGDTFDIIPIVYERVYAVAPLDKGGAGCPIASISGNGTTVTVTTTIPHEYYTGNTVQILGVTVVTGYNTTGNGSVITVTGPTTFTYANATTGAATVTGATTLRAFVAVPTGNNGWGGGTGPPYVAQDSAGVDQTQVAGLWSPSAGQTTAMFSATGIWAQPLNGYSPSVFVIGDSRIVGRGAARMGVNTKAKSSGDLFGDISALDRAFYNGGRPLLPWVKMCKTGEQTLHAMDAGSAMYGYQKFYNGIGCSDFICDYGINDLSAGLTVTQVQNRLLALHRRAKLAGQYCWQTTLEPVTSTTDAYTTASGQTPGGYETGRLAINAWLRDLTATGFIAAMGGSKYAGVIDSAALVEVDSTGVLSLTGGRWPAGTLSASGTSTGSSSTTLTDSGASWTTNQWAGQVISTTSGAGLTYAEVLSNTATVITIASQWNNSTPTVGQTYRIVDNAATGDGVHAAERGYWLMAPAFTAAANLILAR